MSDNSCSPQAKLPDPAPEHMLLGVGVLALISDWDAWVSRRVDSFWFAGDDERVLQRRQSMDFMAPAAVARFAEPAGGADGVLVPITVVDKWRLPQFSLRDEDGQSLSLLSRESSTQVAASALIALASFVVNGSVWCDRGCGRGNLIPHRVRAYLIEVVRADPPEALQLCAELGRRGDEGMEMAGDERTRSVDEEGGEEGMRRDDAAARDWFARLASSELFMGLAYELARGFILFALYPPGTHGRKVLKFSYNSYVVPARRDRRAVRLAHLRRWMRAGSRDVTDSMTWERRRDGWQRADGRIVFSTLCNLVSKAIRDGAANAACALVTVTGPDGRRRTLRLRVNAAMTLEHAPAGTYTVQVTGCSGFTVDRHTPWTLQLRDGDTQRVEVRATASDIAAPVTLAPPLLSQPASHLRKAARGFAWLSKPLAIRVRVGDGGAYHCEFEAPPGLHVTRARLVSNVEFAEDPDSERARELDLVLASTQRAHLYTPTHTARPAAAYAYFNLRPRVETIARPAFWTACIAAVALFFVSATWRTATGFAGAGPADSTALVVLVLGAPSALAAYFAQAVPSRVTNSMLYGLRLSALLPAFLSVLAGAVMLVGEKQHGAHWVLWGLAALSLVAICMLGATQHLAEHPREQRSRDLEQGRDFESAYSAAGPAAGRIEAASKSESEAVGTGAGSVEAASKSESDVPTHIGPQTNSDAAADSGASSAHIAPALLSDRLLERSAGFSRATRRMLLTQRGRIRREYKVPPALYFDSAETPPTFVGLGDQNATRSVWSQARKLMSDADDRAQIPEKAPAAQRPQPSAPAMDHTDASAGLNDRDGQNGQDGNPR